MGIVEKRRPYAYIPTEILEIIFSHLDVITLGRASQVRRVKQAAK